MVGLKEQDSFICSKYINFNPFDSLPIKYKKFYGIRFCGNHEKDLNPMFYGFDIWYRMSSLGLDLETFLFFCKNNNYHIDWCNFIRASVERGGWSKRTIITKIKYPILDVYDQTYWDSLELRVNNFFDICNN